MDFVYICRDGENEELRYSIRSLVENFPDSKITVVGGAPSWYSGRLIKVKDTNNKFENINKCYEEICGMSDIENFILMNDDFFILKNPESINAYYDGSIDEKITRHISYFGSSKYTRILSHVNKKLKKMGIKSPINYDVHMPMLFNKNNLSSVVSSSLAPRSMYGNIFSVGGEKIEDPKVYKHTREVNLDLKFLSTVDNSFNKVSEFLDSRFPNKTIYESN